MLQTALAAGSQIGSHASWIPLEETVRQRKTNPPEAGGSVASAVLSAEEDFELGQEFLDVFVRASERAVGFVVGCTLIGALWLAVELI